MKQAQRKAVQVVLTDKILEQLDEECYRTADSRSQLIRMAVREWLERRAKEDGEKQNGNV